MSEPIFEQCVDERGNISVRVSRDVQVLTREEANHIEAEYKRMQAENAKLRELVRDIYGEYRYLRVRFHRTYVQHEERMRAVEQRMRELGVEVDG